MADEVVKTERSVLERIKYAAQQVLDRHSMDAMVEFSDLADFYGRGIAMRVVAFHYGDEQQVVEVRYPADWWQHVKQRFAPRWALRRWPVRLAVQKVEARVIYPNLRVTMPNEQHVPIVRKVD